VFRGGNPCRLPATKEARQKRIRKVHSSTPDVDLPPPPPPSKSTKKDDFVLQRCMHWPILAPSPALFSRSQLEMSTLVKRGGCLHTMLRLTVPQEVVEPRPVGATSVRETAGGGHRRSALIRPDRPGPTRPPRPPPQNSFRPNLYNDIALASPPCRRFHLLHTPVLSSQAAEQTSRCARS